MSEKDNKFPVLFGRSKNEDNEFPEYVRWSELSERWAQKNHGQTLTRLAERGGLSPCEIVGNVNRIEWINLSSITESQKVELLTRIGSTK